MTDSSINQLMNQSSNQSINQSIKQASNQAINQLINQSINQAINYQSLKQSIKWKNHDNPIHMQGWKFSVSGRISVNQNAPGTISVIRANPLRKYFGIYRGVGGVCEEIYPIYYPSSCILQTGQLYLFLSRILILSLIYLLLIGIYLLLISDNIYLFHK